MSISDIFGIHDKIAADVCEGKRHTLHCATCGAAQECNESQFADYLAHGWPKHCGYTMRLESHVVKKAKARQ